MKLPPFAASGSADPPRKGARKGSMRIGREYRANNTEFLGEGKAPSSRRVNA